MSPKPKVYTPATNSELEERRMVLDNHVEMVFARAAEGLSTPSEWARVQIAMKHLLRAAGELEGFFRSERKEVPR